ncbi:MAG: lysozyme [Solirubrobacteraceae bacterium]
MKFSNAGAALLEGFEGFRSQPYRDAVGVWTIGFGSTKGVGPRTPPVTRAEARARMKREIDANYGAAVERAITRPMTQNQFDAMTSLAYNVGTGGFASSTVCRMHNAGRHDAAADAFMLWVKAGGQTLQGLVNRRRAEADLYRSGRPAAPASPVTGWERYRLRALTAKGVSRARRTRAARALAARRGWLLKMGRRKGWRSKRARSSKWSARQSSIAKALKRFRS